MKTSTIEPIGPDRNGNPVGLSDRFIFEPPTYWDEDGSPEYLESVRGIRGRRCQIRNVATWGGLYPTVYLKSADPVMQEWIRGLGKIGCAFPLSWLKLID